MSRVRIRMREMRRVRISGFAWTMVLAWAVVCAVSTKASDDQDRFSLRDQDWRNGAIVYQVLVDRFVPSANLDSKHHL